MDGISGNEKKIKTTELRDRLDAIDKKTNVVLQERDNVADKYEKASCVAQNATIIIPNIEKDFNRCTGLDTKDMTFLIIGVALHCARQYIFSEINQKSLDDKAAAEPVHNFQERIFKKAKNKAENASSKKESRSFYASRTEILEKPGVPYDTINGTKVWGVLDGVNGLGGTTHRHYTLGHDPWFGWVFGTGNILTNTMTINTMRTCEIQSGKVITHATPWRTVKMMNCTKKRFDESKEDVTLALIKQGLHLASDTYSKTGIGIPGSTKLSYETATMLGEYGIDTAGLIDATGSRSLAKMINFIISVVHGLFYVEVKQSLITDKLYQIKTKKIAMYSSVISTMSNVIASAIGSYLGMVSGNPETIKKSIKSIDFGGIILTLSSLFF